MPTSVAIIADEPTTRERLAALTPVDVYTVAQYAPDGMPAELPDICIVALSGLEMAEARLIEQLRADDTTANIPIVIASSLPMNQLQSLPYASDWTIAIVEEPVDPQILAETMQFLLGSE